MVNDLLTPIILFIVTISFIAGITIWSDNLMDTYMQNKENIVTSNFIYSNNLVDFDFDYSNTSTYITLKPHNLINMDLIDITQEIYDKDDNLILSNSSILNGNKIEFNFNDSSSYDKLKIIYSIYYNGNYIYEQGYDYINNSNMIKFKGYSAEVNGEMYRDYYTGVTNKVHLIYEDEYKYINENLTLNGVLNLNENNLTTKEFNFTPNSEVIINNKKYNVDGTGKLDITYDQNFPNVKMYFFNAEESYIADLSSEGNFTEPELYSNIEIRCEISSVETPCNVVLKYTEDNIFKNSITNVKNGFFNLIGGSYKISVSSELGYGSSTPTINSDNQIITINLS